MTVIPLGRTLPCASSYLPAGSASRITACLFGIAPGRDCSFHPPHDLPTTPRLVSVALILTSRWMGVTHYPALWSPDFPLCQPHTATVWCASAEIIARGLCPPQRTFPAQELSRRKSTISASGRAYSPNENNACRHKTRHRHCAHPSPARRELAPDGDCAWRRD